MANTNIVDEKKKLLEKQDYSVLHSRFEAEKDIVIPEVSLTTAAGGLQEASTGTVFEPPFLCEWIIDPFKPLFCKPEESIKLDKAIYGKSKYGWSFYDPAYDILHIIKTMQLAFVRPEISKNLGRILVGSGVSDIAGIEMIFQHRAIDALIREIYARGGTKISGPKDIYDRLETVEWNGTTLYKIYIEGVGEVWFDTISNLLLGVILGVTPLGYGFLIPMGVELFSPDFFRWLSDRSLGSALRFMPAFAAGKGSKKTIISYGLNITKESERYGELRALYYHIRRMVWNLLEGYGLDTITRQSYVSASIELAFSPIPPKFKEEVYVRKYKWDLDWDELVKHWTAKWEALGLNKEILIFISEKVRPEWERLRLKHRVLSPQ